MCQFQTKEKKEKTKILPTKIYLSHYQNENHLLMIRIEAKENIIQYMYEAKKIDH